MSLALLLETEVLATVGQPTGSIDYCGFMCQDAYTRRGAV